MNTPTIPSPNNVDLSSVADEIEALLASGLAERAALALNTWRVAADQEADDDYEFLRLTSSAGRVIDGLDQFGALIGSPRLGVEAY